MNRDLSKIILIDWDENSYELQPRNALHRLKKWEGDEKDTDLVYLASFLKSKLLNIEPRNNIFFEYSFKMIYMKNLKKMLSRNTIQLLKFLNKSDCG